MKFVYKPEGAEPKSWDFAPDRLMNAEAEAIERHTGLTFGEFVDKISATSFLAIHGLLYVMLKRTIPTLKWDEVQFSLADVDFELDDAEAADAVRELADKQKVGTLTDAEQATLTKLLEQGVEASPKG
jgi:hypothetical protein